MTASPSTPASSPSEGSPPVNPIPSVLPPTTPPGKTTGNITLTGQVESGVEHGCLILKQGGKTYLLLGGDPAVVRAGAQVQVTGRLNPDLMSYCMQGMPFQVTEAHPA